MKKRQYKYTLKVALVDPCEESPILELVSVLQKEARRLADAPYASKAIAINTKWYSLSFLRAEICALDKQYASSTVIPLLDKSLIISKIETYLTTARAILDIAAYFLTHSLKLRGYAQSFNEMRKRGDLPDWLSTFVRLATKFDKTASMSENGWLLNLVTDDTIHGKSLRDFVMHSGTVDLQSVQQFDGEYLFAFKPRKGDHKLYHIEDMVDIVHRGICELFQVMVEHLSPSEIEQKGHRIAHPRRVRNPVTSRIMP